MILATQFNLQEIILRNNQKCIEKFLYKKYVQEMFIKDVCIHRLILSFDHYCVLDTVLGLQGRAVIKAEEIPVVGEFTLQYMHFLWEEEGCRQTINKPYIYIYTEPV